MTKKEALKEFKDNILIDIERKYGRNDEPAKCEAWNNFTDMLCKNHYITLSQYENWSNPF